MKKLEQLKNDVNLLKILFNPNTPDRTWIHVHLTEVLRIRNKWTKLVSFAEFIELATQIHRKPFDQRITATGVRILIELSCEGSTSKQKATYSAAINNARKAGCGP